jgi:hypothetical protein
MMLANLTGRRCLCVHTYFDRLKFLNSQFSPMKQTTSRSDRNANVDIVTIVPEYRGFDYIVVGDSILIVDPVTLEIVAVIPA